MERGEVRRLHIIYFLSRMGRIEHPHLIRVHHLNRNGVYLRDVKRWMADLRGKDIAETFAWSYKRRYKNVYVWQDILDDDLITPICDNEYVLKGSEIPAPIPPDANDYGEKKASTFKNENQIGFKDEIDQEQDQSSLNEVNNASPDNSFDSSRKTSSEICEESPLFGSERSTLTEDSTKQDQISPTKHISQGQQFDEFGSFSSSSSYSNLLTMNKKEEKKTSSSEFSLQHQLQESNYTKSTKSNSNGASKMLRNLITCGAVDTNDTALVAVNKSTSKENNNNSVICKGEILGGSARDFVTNWNQQQHQHYSSARRSFDGVEGLKKNEQHKSRFGNSKGVPAAYRPVGAPICSQCGKSFKPEKLHTHMKSCKGLKASAKTATDSVKKTPTTPSTNVMGQLVAISFD